MIFTEMTSLELFREASSVLRNSGIEEPEKEVEILFSSLLNIEREELYGKNPLIGEKEYSRLLRAVTERAEGRPLQYIVGFVEFYGLRIFVGEGVLIPRPETELLVDEVLGLKKRGYINDKAKVLDLCTGSGCIALCIAHEMKKAHVIGTDSSEAALSYARRNMEHLGITNVDFLIADLFPETVKVFDLILSNPPYVKKEDMDKLEPHVRMEPFEALYGGDDGLHFYRRIISGAKAYLKSGGFLVLEMGAGQAEEITTMAEKAGFTVFRTKKDLTGIERIIVLRQGVGCRNSG